jgi:hypothetical protein
MRLKAVLAPKFDATLSRSEKADHAVCRGIDKSIDLISASPLRGCCNALKSWMLNKILIYSFYM